MKLSFPTKTALFFLKPISKASAVEKIAFYQARYRIITGNYSNKDIDLVIAHISKPRHDYLKEKLYTIKIGKLEFRRLLRLPTNLWK